MAANKAVSSQTESEKDTVLQEGQLVRNRWRVMEKLGQGGFGAVYKVQNVEKPEDVCAMKIESMRLQDSMVKMESFVLKKFRDQHTPQRHVCRYYESGEVAPTFRYLVMQLVGRSISDLRRSSPEQRFSASTTTRMGMQCLDAIESLHRIGFLHRDIKPGNFTIGANESDTRNVYMLDFGLARQYIGPDGTLRRKRPVAGFRGTVRYASMNTHLHKELGRQDDLISLMYMLVECHRGCLPWRKFADKTEVLKQKEKVTAVELTATMDVEYTKMYETAKALTYEQTPNYAWFRLQFKTMAIRNCFTNEKPLDWEPGAQAYESVQTCLVALEKKRKTKKSKKSKKVKERLEGEEHSAVSDKSPKLDPSRRFNKPTSRRSRIKLNRSLNPPSKLQKLRKPNRRRLLRLLPRKSETRATNRSMQPRIYFLLYLFTVDAIRMPTCS